MIFEDFYPINDEEVLVVSGPSLTHLNQILKIDYKNGIIPKEIVRTGTYLRLGNYFKGKLIYSDNYDVFEDGKFLREGIQPYMTEFGLLYQHHGVIFLDDIIIIKPEIGYFTVGRPTFSDGIIYYETRKSEAPQGWEVWKYDMNTGKNEFVCDGCNAFGYKDMIYYQKWNNGEFELCHRKK